MGRDRHLFRAFICMFAVALLAAPGPLAADSSKSSKGKDKAKGDDSITWTPLLEVVARAPAFAAGTYQASRPLKIDEKIVKFVAKLESAEGKGGNMVITLYKQGKPVKKIPVMKHNREGEREVTIIVEPGDYKIEVSVNNVVATVSVSQGKKK